jgi:hypothetical protein
MPGFQKRGIWGNNMKSMNSSAKLLAVFLCGAALVGCNVAEDTDESPVFPNPAVTVAINGDVSGLGTARPVSLKMVTLSPPSPTTPNVVPVPVTRTFAVRGTNVLRFGAVPVGTQYTITVDAQPYARSCTIVNGTGVALSPAFRQTSPGSLCRSTSPRHLRQLLPLASRSLL